MAHRFVDLTLLHLFTCLTFLVCPAAKAQSVEWRFGMEDTYSQLGGLLNESDQQRLLDQLRSLVQMQSAGGDININGTAGGWAGMQAFQTSPINFSASDAYVRLLQDHGFSMLWNIRINALWSQTDNPDCYSTTIIPSCAPDPAHEQDLYDYIYAIVERYDGDGFEDMGFDTPETDDDLRIPIQFYLMTGEIEFAGATPEPEGGYGDAARSHFWTDNIENLLKTHRIIYRAIHDADPTGYSKLVSSGGVFWDLYTDFPDWPAIEGPTVQARLNGDNNHDAVYTESFNRLKQMLTSFGDDTDGVECDYIGWHPHMPWRETDQVMRFIRTYAGDKPVYIDDMWCNIFLQQRADAPGNCLFTDGGTNIQGDFPNELVPNYADLRRGVIFNQIPGARDWYLLRHNRTLVKAFVSAFGEGAERACVSGIADLTIERLGLGAYINILGSLGEGFPAKPGAYTYKMLIDFLHDFTSVTELNVGSDPRTRVYRFERPLPRGPVIVAWSETGAAPENLDYSIANGEEVSFGVDADSLKITHTPLRMDQTEGDVEFVKAADFQLSIRLGYNPIFIELADLTELDVAELNSPIRDLNIAPNPLSSVARINFTLSRAADVKLEVFDVLGNRIAAPAAGMRAAGSHTVIWNGRDARGGAVPSGVYVCRLRGAQFEAAAQINVMR